MFVYYEFKNVTIMLLSTKIHRYFNENVLNLLQKKEVYSVLDFLRLENKFIQKYTPLTYPEIIEVKKFLAKTFSAPPVTGLKYYQNILANSALISTGISELDELLQGGLFTGTIYEFCGTADSDKFQIILTILHNVLCAGNKAYFLDTKRDFSAKFMKKKLEKDKNQEECLNLLSRILLKHISNKYELISALFDIKQELIEDTSNSRPRIIIIHSISVLFLSSNDHSENNNLLNHLANVLRYIAAEHNVAVIVTNLVTTWTEGDFQSYQETIEKIACGKYWRGVPNVKVKIGKKHREGVDVSLLKFNNVCSNVSCVIPDD